LASSSISSQQTSYRRKRGTIATKKIHRKIKLKQRHIAIAFVLLVGFFYGFSRGYLFLITWEKLTIDEVVITCRKDEIQRDFQRYFERRHLGNILLLNIGELQDRLASHTWVEDVHIRKIFPSTLRIEAIERIPIAVLEKGEYYLIDKEGILLQKISKDERLDLPVLIDDNRFQRDYDRKLALAWACLDGLKDTYKSQIRVLDLTEYENVTLQLKNSETWLKLGNSRFEEKFQSFFQNTALFRTYGPLEYIDFRYEGRFVLRPIPLQERDNALDSEKEAF
jgi:cell division septal protein FtsQ